MYSAGRCYERCVTLPAAGTRAVCATAAADVAHLPLTDAHSSDGRHGHHTLPHTLPHAPHHTTPCLPAAEALRNMIEAETAARLSDAAADSGSSEAVAAQKPGGSGGGDGGGVKEETPQPADKADEQEEKIKQEEEKRKREEQKKEEEGRKKEEEQKTAKDAGVAAAAGGARKHALTKCAYGCCLPCLRVLVALQGGTGGGSGTACLPCRWPASQLWIQAPQLHPRQSPSRPDCERRLSQLLRTPTLPLAASLHWVQGVQLSRGNPDQPPPLNPLTHALRPALFDNIAGSWWLGWPRTTQ